jgi:hypothetical protein
MAFSEFMQKQCDKIKASGLAPEDWIAQNAESFREANPVDEE